MLQNARVAAITVSELLRENQQGSKITPPQPRLELTKKIVNVIQRFPVELFRKKLRNLQKNTCDGVLF